jgi:hypothetical protein
MRLPSVPADSTSASIAPGLQNHNYILTVQVLALRGDVEHGDAKAAKDTKREDREDARRGLGGAACALRMLHEPGGFVFQAPILAR